MHRQTPRYRKYDIKNIQNRKEEEEEHRKTLINFIMGWKNCCCFKIYQFEEKTEEKPRRR